MGHVVTAHELIAHTHIEVAALQHLITRVDAQWAYRLLLVLSTDLRIAKATSSVFAVTYRSDILATVIADELLLALIALHTVVMQGEYRIRTQ